MNLRYKLAQLLSGRYISYGIDLLSKVLAVVCIILSASNIFVNSLIIYIVETILFFWLIYRLFSRNIYARQKENQKLIEIKNKIKNFFALKKRMHSERDTHIYKKCPHCLVMLRLPKRPGEHTVICPRCKNSFNVKVR